MIARSKIPNVAGGWVGLTARWSCQFLLRDGRFHASWNHHKPPTRRQLMKMLGPYRRARQDFTDMLLKQHGIKVLLLELQGEIQ